MRLKDEQAVFKPRLNLGFPFDVFTGRWYEGVNGESILNGGLGGFTGIGGPPNMHKSSLAHFFNLIINSRINHCSGMVYDTETTFSPERFNDFMHNIRGFEDKDVETLVEEGKLSFYDRIGYFGEHWYSDLRKEMTKKALDKKSYITLPFVNKITGELVKIPPIDVVEMDSMTEFTIEGLENKRENVELGHKDLNMEAMDEMKAKSHMVRKFPSASVLSSTFIIATAHVGEEHKLDPYAVTPKKLMYLKGNAKFKRVPNQFNFLPMDVYYIYGMETMKNSSTKGVEYPSKRYEDFKDNPDLQKIYVYNTRGKGGPTGVPMAIMVSQAEGILVGLTAFEYCKKDSKFGIGGNDRNYYMELYPEVTLSRTTIRDIITEDPRLQTALHFTAELNAFHKGIAKVDRDLLCTPKELYDDLKTLGYDWNVLLDTRQHYVPLEEEKLQTQPFLSTKDLLRMRKELYRPKWLK